MKMKIQSKRSHISHLTVILARAGPTRHRTYLTLDLPAELKIILALLGTLAGREDSRGEKKNVEKHTGVQLAA